MTPEQKALALRKCRGALYYSRQNPEVGMGPFTEHVVEDVLSSMKAESDVYGGNFTVLPQEKADLTHEVRKMREKENL